MNDIGSHDDIRLLVRSFYDRVLNDELLAPFFARLDFDKHLPKMEHFWAFVLLDEPGYTTNVTEKHMRMRLSKELFDRWVKLFHETTDSLFAGEKVDAAKQRATLLGWTMASKLGEN
jgi:hemoglobin